jgi:hypothetical protein
MPSFREATFSKGGGAPKMSDLKAPTYKDRHNPSVEPSRSDMFARRSVPLRFDMPSFRKATFSKGGGAPKMSDLKAPTYKDRHAQSRALTVVHASP